jgi:hypothetical protein
LEGKYQKGLICAYLGTNFILYANVGRMGIKEFQLSGFNRIEVDIRRHHGQNTGELLKKPIAPELRSGTKWNGCEFVG